MDGVVLVPMGLQVLQSVGLNELVSTVTRLRVHIHACHVESGSLVALGTATCTAVQIKESASSTACPCE